MFNAVWQWICAHPFFGVGFNLQSLLNSLSNTTGSHWYPHNIFLDAYGIGGLLLICAYGGMVVFAYYSDCDPIGARQVEKSDQIFPLFVMQVMGDVTPLAATLTKHSLHILALHSGPWFRPVLT